MEALEVVKDLKQSLLRGEFVVSIQVDPPLAKTGSEFTEIICQLLRAGVTLVDINSSRRISHDSLHLAVMLRSLGLEVIPHITTRDSSVNGLINQILAAYTWGDLRNLLVITGDPYDMEQSISPSRGVFQTDSIGAIKAFDQYLRKNPKLQLDIILAAAINQNEENLSGEGKRIREKRSAGADFFMSQPVFSKTQAISLSRFYQRYSSLPLLVGIWPLTNWKTIENLRCGRVIGTVLPERIYKEALRYQTDELKLLEWGVQKATELIQFVRESGRAQGVYIVAPLRNPLLVLDVFKGIKD